MTPSPGGYKPHYPNVSGDAPADGETVQWDAAAKQWKSVAPSGGGGASTPPGQAAHYIGTWDVAVAYAAGECVRQWDGAAFKLYQAKKATTGDDPTSVVASWAEVTTPIVMWGSEDPNLTDETNPNGGGVPGPVGSLYLWRRSTHGYVAVFIFSDASNFNSLGEGNTDIHIHAASRWGSWQLYTVYQQTSDSDGTDVDASTTIIRDGAGAGGALGGRNISRLGAGAGDADVTTYAQRADEGDGFASHSLFVTRGGTGAGDAYATVNAEVANTAVGTAYAGDKAKHHAGGEAHVLPTANAAGAFNDVKADLVFTDNTEGPVIHDQSDGHTYRIVSTAGVLSTVQVT